MNLIDGRLTRWATEAFTLFHEDTPEERARNVAITTGREAKRLGLTKLAMRKWLQSAYGSVWVKLGNLNPGLDLKEIREIMEAAYATTFERNSTGKDDA
jgi:hypothetical protein